MSINLRSMKLFPSSIGLIGLLSISIQTWADSPALAQYKQMVFNQLEQAYKTRLISQSDYEKRKQEVMKMTDQDLEKFKKQMSIIAEVMQNTLNKEMKDLNNRLDPKNRKALNPPSQKEIEAKILNDTKKFSLDALNQMLQQGAISQEEFNKQKTAIEKLTPEQFHEQAKLREKMLSTYRAAPTNSNPSPHPMTITQSPQESGDEIQMIQSSLQSQKTMSNEEMTQKVQEIQSRIDALPNTP